MRGFLLFAVVGLIAGPANAVVVPVNPNNLIQSGQTQLSSNQIQSRISWDSFGWRALSAPSRGNAAQQSTSHRKIMQNARSLKPITAKRITINTITVTDIRPIAPVERATLAVAGGGGGILAQPIGGSHGKGVMAHTIVRSGGSGGNGITAGAIGGSGGNGGIGIVAQSLGSGGGSGGYGIFAQSIGGNGSLAGGSLLTAENGKSGGGTSVAVSAVPLPAGVLLLGPVVGLGAAAAVRRRRRASKPAGEACAS